jgi:hypothetical protein
MKKGKLLLNVLMVAILVICFSLGTAHAQAGVFPDLSDWVGKSFKVKLSRTVFKFSDIGVKPTPSYQFDEAMGKAYINTTAWDGTNHILTADIYTMDHNTGEWITTPFTTINIQYFAGTDLKFIGSGQIAIPNDVTMNLIFVFTGQKNGAGDFILGGTTKLGTIASSMLEIDDAVGSTERWAGSVKLSGPMVSSIPFTPTP